MNLIHFSSFLESLHCALNLKARLFKFHLVFACHAVFARSRLLIVQLKTVFLLHIHRLFSLYPSGGGCQLLSNWLFAPQRIPTWDISTAIAKSRSGDPAPTYPERFRIQAFSKKIFHIFLFFAEKFEIGRSSCLFQLF